VGGVHDLLLPGLPPEPAHLAALEPRFEELVAVLVLLPHLFLAKNHRRTIAVRIFLSRGDAGGAHLPRQLSQR